jgi:hypothetical protein
MATIENYGDKIPKSYKTNKYGFNNKLEINNQARIIVLAPSQSGKTNLCVDFIAKSPNVYSKVHLIARNPDQELYNYLRDKLGALITIYDSDYPPSVDAIKAIPGELQLVIIDDYSNDKKLQKDLFSHYFTRGRHKGLTTIFCSHSFFGTDKMIRLNAEICCILKANSKRDLKLILTDFNISGMTLDDFYNAYSSATSEKGQFLKIDSINDIVRKNWTGEIYNSK